MQFGKILGVWMQFALKGLCGPIYGGGRRMFTQANSRVRMAAKTAKCVLIVLASMALFSCSVSSEVTSGTEAASLDESKNLEAEKSLIPKPKATITGVDVHVNLKEVTFHIKVSVSNPYPISIPIGNMSYSVKCAGREVVSGGISDPGSLKARDKTRLDATAKVPYKAVLNLIRDIGGDGDVDYAVDLKLILDLPIVKKFPISVSFNGQFKLTPF